MVLKLLAVIWLCLNFATSSGRHVQQAVTEALAQAEKLERQIDDLKVLEEAHECPTLIHDLAATSQLEKLLYEQKFHGDLDLFMQHEMEPYGDLYQAGQVLSGNVAIVDVNCGNAEVMTRNLLLSEDHAGRLVDFDDAGARGEVHGVSRLLEELHARPDTPVYVKVELQKTDCSVGHGHTFGLLFPEGGAAEDPVYTFHGFELTFGMAAWLGPYNTDAKKISTVGDYLNLLRAIQGTRPAHETAQERAARQYAACNAYGVVSYPAKSGHFRMVDLRYTRCESPDNFNDFYQESRAKPAWPNCPVLFDVVWTMYTYDDDQCTARVNSLIAAANAKRDAKLFCSAGDLTYSSLIEYIKCAHDLEYGRYDPVRSLARGVQVELSQYPDAVRVRNRDCTEDTKASYERAFSAAFSAYQNAYEQQTPQHIAATLRVLAADVTAASPTAICGLRNTNSRGCLRDLLAMEIPFQTAATCCFNHPRTEAAIACAFP